MKSNMSTEAQQLQEHLLRQPQHYEAIELALQILSFAIAAKPANVERLLQIKGAKRVYFAKSAEEILASGRSTAPRHIPDTELYVLTNEDNEWKREICIEALRHLGFPPDAVSVVKNAFKKVCEAQDFVRGLP